MNQLTKFNSEQDLKRVLAGEYQKQIANFFGKPEKALEFLSNVVAAVQRNPKLLECTPSTVINGFMLMASLKLMPSGASGEAFVIPYKNKGVLEAQFQLGYQGIVTLLYRAGNKDVVAELVREKDELSISRGKIEHKVDPRKSREERGDVIGAYAIITTSTGGTVETFMRKEDIEAHAAKFSKSFSSEYSPWNAKNDPEGWMPRKTVLKQAAKLAPKNEALNKAIEEDNKDSIISDRLNAAKVDSAGLAMGKLIKHGKEAQDEAGAEDQSANTTDDAAGVAEDTEATIE
jgi:recombination protein RecT